jgi:hypothetical protein
MPYVACSPTSVVHLSVSWCCESRLREVFEELLDELLVVLNNVRFVYQVSFKAFKKQQNGRATR